MELQEFISSTLQQIMNGVKDAQAQVKDTGGYIGPGGTHFDPALEMVHFDVAVTVSENTETQGGGKIKVFSFFSAEGKASKAAETACVSRITFDVPTVLPRMPQKDN